MARARARAVALALAVVVAVAKEVVRDVAKVEGPQEKSHFFK
jgi:hypothetical protein